MILWFDQIGNDFEKVGGKALNLADMYKKGLNVPKGFAITTEAYEAYISKDDLKEKIDTTLEADLDLENKSKKIQAMFKVENMSESLKDMIVENFKAFESKRVAVRSSSTAEDLPGMSFAGQYTTYLNVLEEGLLDAVIKCWRSLYNARAIDYRLRQGIHESFSHAVLVQEMVESEKAGVCFSANPINGRRDQVVVEASFGLGEAIVSGEVVPDQYIIDKATRVIDAKIHKKHMKYVYDASGIKAEVIDSDKACLHENELYKLLDASKKIQDYFSKPQDMEFAFDKSGELYILQSRDITTLYPIDGLKIDGKIRGYMSASTVLLGVREPFTPLGYELMSHMFPGIINIMTARKKKPLTNSFVAFPGNRIYVDMTYLLSSKFVAKQFAKAFSGNDLPLEGVMNQMLDDYGKAFRGQGIHFKPPLGAVKYSFSMIGSVRRIMKIPNNQRYEAMIEEGNRWYDDIVKKYESLSSIEEKLDFSEYALVQAFKLSQAQAMYCLDANNYIKIEKVLKKHFNNEYAVETLVQSLPGCFTQTMTIKLNEYAKYCSENKLSPSKDHDMFKEILEIYGHRATVELDFGTKRWREDPNYLLDLVKSYMADDMYKRNLLDHEAKKKAAEDMIEEVSKRLIDKMGKKRADKFRTYMINYRYAAAMREYPKSDIVRFLELARKAVLSIGEDYVSDNILDVKEDIFFLRRSHILEAKDLKAKVDSAKEIYSKEMKRKSIPRMLLNNGHTYYTSSMIDPNSKVLQGMALSVGVYEGNIKIVMDPHDHDLKEGEIMVTESTNPAWTPLFATAGGLIMEYGGPMSHGGIVAREYGIPAVVGISGKSLKDGMRVRVNGETGTIEIL
ncbi:hypothetical protein EZV73_20975 [Acidaminobacter sp. JC074]|uniref:PEP/pyruvate-binding domain-containing protein n=1 Tax=Acidaminobacter sp. JC074 TaxID=2530199 RepID=UPI001F10F633|nr:PEP/pyruvate-binding domain-containing protein [Acidaminobacter sp. JC074]MCH4890066.1 hypothetical protein [Acidaminobacter sp. JC074]